MRLVYFLLCLVLSVRGALAAEPTSWFDASADRLPGPVLHLACEENAADTVVVNAMGAAIASTRNTADFTDATGKLGRGFDFYKGGTDDRINSGLTITGPFSVCAWVKPDSAGEMAGRIVDSGSCRAWVTSTTFNLSCGAELGTGVGYWTAGNWAHVCFRRSLLNIGSIFVNGVSVVTPASIGAGAFNNFYIGNSYNDTRAFDGVMDDIRVWDREITPQEVKEVYNAGNGTVGSEAAQGKISTDSSGNVYGWASKVGSYDFYQLTAGYRPAFATFKNRRCIDFDGTDDGLVSGAVGTDILDTTDGTVFIVAETDSNVTAQHYLSSGSEWSIRQNVTSILGHYSDDGGGADEAPIGIGSNVPYIIEADYDSTALGVTVNGQTVKYDASDYLSLGGTLRIGNAGSADLNGRICEILTFDTLLDTIERRKIREYLRKKWGLKYHTIPEPVVHYRLDENAANTTIYDSISAVHGAAAATNTADMSVAGKVGGGMYINQTTNNLITIADNAVFDSPYEITAMAWIKLDNNSSGNEYFVGKYYSDANKREWALRINSTQKFSIMLGHPVTGAYLGYQEMDTPLADVTIWNHVAATFNNGKVKLYVNGDLVPTSDYGVIPATLHQNDAAFTIGGLPGSATHDGVIDDVIFYNKALSAADIKFIYNETAQGRAASTY